MTQFRRTLLAWASTALLLTLCLLPKSLLPGDETGPKKIPHLDKLVHFGMFAGFGMCWAFAVGTTVPACSQVTSILAVAFALAVGTELAQGLPQIRRDPDTLDALADAAGAVVGVGAVVARRMPRDDPAWKG